MRQFVLYNAAGQSYSLNDLSSFLQNPKKLGMKRKVGYERIGNTFAIVSDELEQKKPTGEICFEGYEEYFEFAQFISKRPLTMEYTAAGTYRLDVTVTELDKTELEEGGLVCKITMESIGTYYQEVVLRNTDEQSGKVYPYTYPYTYNDFLSGTIVFESDTMLESPVRISIIGPCQNPSWAHYVNGVLVGKGKMALEISENRKLVISTRSAPWSIEEYDLNNNLIANRYENSDFSTKRFVNFQRGKNTLVFTHEGNSEIKIIVEAAILYETV